MVVDLYPVRVEWQNVAVYRDAHDIDLVPAVYAVTATAANNPQRSNWLGKSTLLGLVPLALFGVHPYQVDDDWITYGEHSAHVKITFSDGTVVTRQNPRGKTVQLTFEAGTKRTEKDRGVLTQKAAQAAIEKWLGMGRDDFMAVCYFQQGQMGRFVTARSSDRLEIVDAWLADDIDPIQALCDRAVAGLASLSKRLGELDAEAGGLKQDARQLMQDRQFGEGVDIIAELAISQAKADAVVNERKAALATARDEWERQAELRQQEVKAAEYVEVCERGIKLRDEYNAIGIDDDAAEAVNRRVQASAIALTAREKQLAEARRLQCGEWDKRCPIVGHTCPSWEWVFTLQPGEQKLAELVRCRNGARNLHEAEVQCLSDTQAKLARRQELSARLDELRKQAIELQPAAEAARNANLPDQAEARDALHVAESALNAAVAVATSIEEDRVWVNDAIARLRVIGIERGKLKEQIALYREAVALLGRTGAQRIVAEQALAQVEAGANAVLTSAGIDLRVAVQWSREGKGLAKVCDQCGAAYPASQRVKECPSCSAKRGPHLIPKLEISLSNRSGAAEALAGIAVGLAANQWLKAKRGSRWSAVYLDEPFGELDVAHKQALSVHVATILRQSFACAFVVAHDKGILDGLPAQLRIVGESNGSKVVQS